jgi:hypothetical protein
MLNHLSVTSAMLLHAIGAHIRFRANRPHVDLAGDPNLSQGDGLGDGMGPDSRWMAASPAAGRASLLPAVSVAIVAYS